MAIDLVSAVERYLTPDVVGKLAAATGLSETTTHDATRAAAPAILSVLSNMVTQPGGSKKLADAVASQPAGMLSDIVGKFSGSSQMATQGCSLLSSLLGGSAISSLTSTVAKYLGIGEGPAKMLMGLLTPVVLGVLGNQQRAANLDNNGLARLLSGQKEQIAEAMPAGLSDALSRSGLHASAATTPVQDYPAAPVPASHRAADSTRSTSWAYWALPLLLLGGILWYLMPSAHRNETVEVPQPASKVVQSPERPNIYLAKVPEGWISIGSRPNEFVNRELHNRAGERLGTIKDILIDAQGRAAGAVVDVGQFLGIGEKQIVVPYTVLRPEPQGGARRIIIDATREQLQAAPAVVLQR